MANRKYGDDSGGIMYTNTLDSIVKKLDIPAAVMEAAGYAVALRVEKLAKGLCPVDIGNLRDNIAASKSVTVSENKATSYVVADSEYAAYVELGTGIHGPKHQRIVPKAYTIFGTTVRKQFLVWQDKSGNWFRARSTQGMKPRPYLAPAVFETKEHLGAIAGNVINQWLRSLKGSGIASGENG